MGSYLSTNRTTAEESELQSALGAYRFPPKSGGPYFSNHFIMGGEKFDTPQPEAFLFGENSDLNFLGTKPAPFPYPPPQATEPTKTLRSLINIRRDSVHLVPVPDQTPIPSCPSYDSDADEYQQQRICDESQRIWALHRERKYNLQFTFDSDVRCAITICYFSTEEISPIAATYTPSGESGFKSETYYYKRGANQPFNQPNHVIQPGSFKDSDLSFRDNSDSNETGNGLSIVPVAIQCVALDGDSPRQAHTTVASFERNHEGAYVLKNIKQKLFVDGLSYLLQEIYGLENKTSDPPNKFEEDFDDCGADCVVCMCDLRDTIILPCRHLCLCYACAESLRYQASNCPICRAPFIALLQIRAVQKMSHNTHPALAGTEPTAQEGVPPGYTSISLVEALNGPSNRDPNREITPALPPQPAVVSLPAGAALETSLSNSGAGTDAMPSVPLGSSGAVAAAGGGPGRFAHVKKSRGKRRGSKESSRPRHSGSVSSQMSATSPLTEEPEMSNEASESSSSTAAVASAASASVPPTKVKSADTNVRVSLKIVNEVETGVKTSAASPSAVNPASVCLDIVEEELAKMAVAESLNDIPIVGIGSRGEAALAVAGHDDATTIEEIDLDDDDVDDDDSTDDEAGQEGDDEDDLDEDDANTVVVNLPALSTNMSKHAAGGGGCGGGSSSTPLGSEQLVSETPGTPLSQSDRSSHNSASSSGSTKLLLPKEEGQTTPVQHESKIVMVTSRDLSLVTSKDDDDDDIDDIEDNEDFC